MSTREMVDSGVEWIGEIPASWKVVRLRSLALIETGSMNTDDREDNGIYPLYVRSKTIEKSNKYTHDTSAILVPGEGLIGEIFHLATGKHAVHQRVYSIQPYKGNFIKYIRYFMIAGFGTWAKKNSNTVTVESLRRPTFLNFILSLPPLSEQQSIANFLDHHVNLIDCEASLIDKKMELLGEKRKALIFECVTGKRTVVPRSSLTDTANVVGHGDWVAVSTDDEQLVDSGVDWIGDIPKEWEISKMANLVNEINNKNKNTVEKNLLSLSYGKIIRKNIHSSEGLLPANFEGYNRVSPGNVVLRLTDLQNDQRSLRTGFVLEKGIITSAYTTIETFSLNKKYFSYLMHACDTSKVFYGLGGGVRQSMTFQDVKKIILSFPPSLEEQQYISIFLDTETSLIDKEISLLKQKQDLLIEKRKALIFEAVTGKIDCRSWTA